jgi:hypothetical protein
VRSRILRRYCMLEAGEDPSLRLWQLLRQPAPNVQLRRSGRGTWARCFSKSGGWPRSASGGH